MEYTRECFESGRCQIEQITGCKFREPFEGTKLMVVVYRCRHPEAGKTQTGVCPDPVIDKLVNKPA